MERYVCIHGHFYQPPRENPWLEAIEVQDSAYPFHDWNERVDAECYAPNSASRVLDGDGCIVDIVNNYSWISYNFGPTLLAWLAEKSQGVYDAVQVADRESQQRFSGHGSALAQAYNHMIMPLANSRDKYTQIRWGIRDFEARYGRAPEGMWLPETAVDLETLDLMAQQGIKFTVLAPSQAHRVRPIKGRSFWRDVGGGRIDPSMAYRVRTGAGRSIAAFFYDGPISRAVAFEHLLDRGENLAGRIVGSFSDQRVWPQLAHIATDGETYGHHHRHGEMALSYALHYIEQQNLAKLTNYGEFLAKHPPTHQAEIYEKSSWSCVHGVERWRSNCGCNSGGHSDWNQQWREPLRNALDWLRDRLAPFFSEQAGALVDDPWAARNDYINVILDRHAENRSEFLARHAKHDLSHEEEVRLWKLLEMQRHAMLMYTSCGWFFDELTGIETVQVIHYAGRALQLAQEMGAPADTEPGFLERLEQAKSNIPEHGDGKHIFEKWVRPAMVDLLKVGAHYAVSSLFNEKGPEERIYAFTVKTEDYRLHTAGRARLAFGRARITSEITTDWRDVSFGVLHLGDHNVAGGVCEVQSVESEEQAPERILEVFRTGDMPEVIRLLDQRYGTGGTYSLKLLFRDEQRRIIRQILAAGMDEAESMYRQLYRNQAVMMRFTRDCGIPLPKRLEIAAEFTLNTDLRRAFENVDLDFNQIRSLIDEATTAGISLDATTLDLSLRRTLERLANRFEAEPDNLALLEQLENAVAVARSLPFEVVIWHVQNVYVGMMRRVFPEYLERVRQGDEAAVEWAQHFRKLGEHLRVRIDEAAMSA